MNDEREVLVMEVEKWSETAERLVDDGWLLIVGECEGKPVLEVDPEHRAETLAMLAAVDQEFTHGKMTATIRSLAAEGFFRITGERDGMPEYEIVAEREHELEALLSSHNFRNSGGRVS